MVRVPTVEQICKRYGNILEPEQALKVYRDDSYFHKVRRRPNKYKVSPDDWERILFLMQPHVFTKVGMEDNFLFRGIPIVAGEYVRPGTIRRVFLT